MAHISKSQRCVSAVDGGKSFRAPGQRGGWLIGFKDDLHRANFLAAAARSRLPPLGHGLRPQCIATAKSTGQRCRRDGFGVNVLCKDHDRHWHPKDPNTPRRQRARAIQAAKRYNAQVYALIDADMAMLPPMPPTEYDALRQAMLRGRLIWIPPLAEWIAQGMPWPPDRPPDTSTTTSR